MRDPVSKQREYMKNPRLSSDLYTGKEHLSTWQQICAFPTTECGSLEQIMANTKKALSITLEQPSNLKQAPIQYTITTSNDQKSLLSLGRSQGFLNCSFPTTTPLPYQLIHAIWQSVSFPSRQIFLNEGISVQNFVFCCVFLWTTRSPGPPSL